MDGNMYFNLYGKCYYFQQTGFTTVTINSMGIGIGCTPTSPLQITTYASSTQTYKFLNYNGVGGPVSYGQSYSICCSYAVMATEFDAISDARIKKM